MTAKIESEIHAANLAPVPVDELTLEQEAFLYHWRQLPKRSAARLAALVLALARPPLN